MIENTCDEYSSKSYDRTCFCSLHLVILKSNTRTNLAGRWFFRCLCERSCYPTWLGPCMLLPIALPPTPSWCVTILFVLGSVSSCSIICIVCLMYSRIWSLRLIQIRIF
ncbi:hypothetical protein AAHE18_08G153600 [Arachis hypogaea]